MIWSCPSCRTPLRSQDGTLRCGSGHVYGVIDGIPDLRGPLVHGADAFGDLAEARELAAATDATLEDLVRSFFARRADWDRERIEERTQRVLRAPHRLERELSEWLKPLIRPNDVLLDLGCGPGMLLAAASAHGWPGIGIDASMTLLVVAKRMIVEWGGTPVLAAGFGEALPLPAGSLDLVVSLDVIEHVVDADQYLSEMDRASRAGSRFILTTPNRYSLAAEPHVQVWGVGWLPHSLQAPYVKWVSGKAYDGTRLMSSSQLGRRLKRVGWRYRILPPAVPAEEIAAFSAPKAVLARIYNWLGRARIFRPLFLLVGPFFRVEAVKP